MTTIAKPATPKIVGKALYLELVPDTDNIPESELRELLGWKFAGTQQIIMFPEYQDDTGTIHPAVIMDRTVTSYSPRAQWDMNFASRFRVKPEGDSSSSSDDWYVSYATYSSSEWDELPNREKFEAMKRGVSLMLKNLIISTGYATNAEGDREFYARQAYKIRENKPIAVEVTDEDLFALHYDRKTPQAVIRRINKVRDTLDKFPKKLT
jgi:hypothetical protein